VNPHRTPRMLYAIVAIMAVAVAVAVAVFTLQNTRAVTVTLLVWRISEVPLAALILLALSAGMVLVGVPLWIQRWRLRRQLRVQEAFTSSRDFGAPTASRRPAEV